MTQPSPVLRDLFAGDPTARPPRPNQANLAQKVATELLVMVKRWEPNLGDDAELLEDLVDVISEGRETDGFRLARKLEVKGWQNVDSELVEIMGSAWSIAWDVERAAVKEWVELHGITSQVQVGAIVKTQGGTGRIVCVLADTAQFVVQTDDYLKKNPGQAGNPAGYLIAFENATPVEQAAEAA
jgi:hypothetical protein